MIQTPFFRCPRARPNPLTVVGPVSGLAILHSHQIHAVEFSVPLPCRLFPSPLCCTCFSSCLFPLCSSPTLSRFYINMYIHVNVPSAFAGIVRSGSFSGFFSVLLSTLASSVFPFPCLCGTVYVKQSKRAFLSIAIAVYVVVFVNG